jgi:hypothetical protein
VLNVNEDEIARKSTARGNGLSCAAMPRMERGSGNDVDWLSNSSERTWFMKHYRAFEHGTNGQIANRFDFYARDDEVAKEQARDAASGQDLELWRHDRKVAEWRGQRPGWMKIKRVAHSPN